MAGGIFRRHARCVCDVIWVRSFSRRADHQALPSSVTVFRTESPGLTPWTFLSPSPRLSSDLLTVPTRSEPLRSPAPSTRTAAAAHQRAAASGQYRPRWQPCRVGRVFFAVVDCAAAAAAAAAVAVALIAGLCRPGHQSAGPADGRPARRGHTLAGRAGRAGRLTGRAGRLAGRAGRLAGLPGCTCRVTLSSRVLPILSWDTAEYLKVGMF